MVLPRRGGALFRAVTAPVVGYAALVVAGLLPAALAGLLGFGWHLHLQFVTSVPLIRETIRRLTPGGVILLQIFGELLTVTAVALWLRRDLPLRRLFPHRPTFGDLGFGVLGTLGLLVFVELIGIVLVLLHAVHQSQAQLAFVKGIGSPWLLLPVALAAGLCEETTFRGYVLRSLAGVMPGKLLWLAVALESAIFALFHVGWGLASGPFVVIFGIGIGLTVLALRSNLYIAMVAHAGYDMIAFLIALHAR